MRLYVTRDSVSAGDDVDAPHRIDGVVPDPPTPERIIATIWRPLCLTYLAQIQGGKATWCISSGIPLAVVAQEWSEPKVIPFPEPSLKDLDIADGVIRVHISYLAQIHPEVVYDVLRRVRLKAR